MYKRFKNRNKKKKHKSKTDLKFLFENDETHL